MLDCRHFRIIKLTYFIKMQDVCKVQQNSFFHYQTGLKYHKVKIYQNVFTINEPKIYQSEMESTTKKLSGREKNRFVFIMIKWRQA